MDTVEKDVYVAYQGNSNTYIAIDEYSISRTPTGFLVESNNTVFGASGYSQKAKLSTDAYWQMQELQIRVESFNIEIVASIDDKKLYLQQKQHNANHDKIIDLHKDKHFFLYSGAMIVPFVWLRGFDFNNFEKVIYQMLPDGYAEVKQLRNTDPDQDTREFSLMMCMHNFTDIVKIKTDMFGKMLLFHSETNQITIKIQPK